MVGDGSIMTYVNGNRRVHICKRDGMKIELNGKIRLERGGDGIKSLSRGGSLSIKEESTGREIFIEEEDGELYTVYYQKGKRFDFAGEGQEWFDEVWADVKRCLGK